MATQTVASGGRSRCESEQRSITVPAPVPRMEPGCGVRVSNGKILEVIVLQSFNREGATKPGRLHRRHPATAGRRRARRNRLTFEPLEKRLVLDVSPLLISEFMANNKDTLDDEDGSSSDWIEIYNPSDTAVDLEGYYLTDSADDLMAWQFPAVTLESLDYLLVFASGKDRTDPDGELHTNFGLNDGGDSVALVMPDGETVVHAYWDFPDQLKDVSYGLPDTTTLWEKLVSSGTPATYHVPTPGEDIQTWTEQDYDDSTWVDAVSLEPPSLVITEVETGDPDWLEIQNVSDQTLATQDWFVAVNDTTAGDINTPHGLVWQLPASITSGEVLYRTEDAADMDNYWGSEISWGTGSGWVMIVDGDGDVVDFVPWGYSEAEIADMVIDTAAFTNISVGFPTLTVGSQWQGTGVPGGAGQVELIDIEHRWWYEESNTDLGTAWRDPDYDVEWPDSGKALLYNEGSALPAPKNTPLTLGASTYYFRSYFTLDAHPDSVTQLDLRTVIDDGAVIYINGKEVFRLGFNEDDVITHGLYARRTVGNASYETNTVPENKLIQNGESVLVAGENLIAVEVHQTNATSSDVVMGLELEATILQPKLERVGNSDVNGPGDFDLPPAPSQGVQNAALTVPFVPGEIPALTGLGYSDDGDFNEVVLTDVEQAMRDQNASLWSRIEFPVGDPSQFDVLTLNMKYDDGFVAYLNGVEIARRLAPDVLETDSAATGFRTDPEALVFEEIDVSDYLGRLRQLETNVLAIHGLNLDDADEDFLILPELIATSNLEGPQYMTSPTPWNDNLAGALGRVEDTQFSVDRGFYDEPFDVEITTDTIAAEIRYTLDGSPPTATTGTVYTGPISVVTTTVLRAAAFKPGYIPTNVDTHTYIFLNDVVHQPGDPAGFPGVWGGTTADYAMDPDVIGTFDPDGNPNGDDIFGGVYANQIRDSLLSIPTMSIVTTVDDMFGEDGIYTKSNSQGLDYERPTSVEWINTDGTTGFQVDAGLRIYGGAFRGMNLTRKKTFRLLFKGVYGPTKLDFPLFDDKDAATRFDTIILRGGANDGWNNWGKEKTQYIVDEFMRRTQLALGQPSGHGTFVHLYVNGLYWGLYNPVERPEASFAATYFGGEKENWDAINSGAATGESSTATWNELLNFVRNNDMSTPEAYQLLQGNDPDGTRNPAYNDLLDIDNYIAYMFSNFWGGKGDWPGHNWYGAAPKPPDTTGYKFFNWDSEGAIIIWSDLNADRTGVNNSAAEPYAALRSNEEFKLLFADYAHQWLFNGGPATSGPSHARYQELADEIELALIAESARWGDQARAAPHTQAEWAGYRDYILNTYMPQRPAVVLQDLRDAGLYPQLDAPVVDQQHGGQIDPGFELTLTIPTGGSAVYTDTLIFPEFSEARYFVPPDDSLGTTWTEWGFDDSSWGVGQTGIGYENSAADFQNLIKTPVKPSDVHAGATSILVRISFTINDISEVDRLNLKMKYDDGFVAFINGEPVARRNFNGTLSWNTDQASNHSDGQAVQFEDVLVPNATYPVNLSQILVEGGENVLAIHALNTSAGSSDMLILPELWFGTVVEDPTPPGAYYTIDGSDPRLPGGAVNTDLAILYDPDQPIQLTESAVIKMRTYQGGVWSALNEAEFFVGPQATAENLVITEINYNPYAPPEGDETYNNDDFEFIELYNRGAETIDLSGLEFTEGIHFDFTGCEVGQLAPGGFVVVVSNQAAFAERYDTAGVLMAGQYTGNLDNGGEPIELLDWQGQPIAAFAYNDGGNWPGRADGSGASLELESPELVPQNDPDRTLYLEDNDSWRSSGEYGGSPGAAGTGLLGDIVINEVLSHTDDPLSDSIELHNTTGAEIAIGGWYLSDDNNQYLKFRIPNDTSIPAGGYLVFDEDDFNPTPLSPGPNDFALDGAHGDDVWLMEADGAGNLVRFVDHVDFGAAINGESFGRWPNGEGDLYPTARRTLDPAGPNSGPRIGPVVISEVHYNPDTGAVDDDDFEFVEIYNPTGTTVDLTDWRIRKGIDYDFPDGTLLPSAAALVIVPFDTSDVDKLTAFRDRYGLDTSVTLLGGYSGQLDDDGERVRLQRPDTPPAAEPEYIPRLLEDEVRYYNQLPWPTEADGSGQSLNRAANGRWGNNPYGWVAQSPSPGTALLLEAATVVDRHLFYNHSALDGNTPGAHVLDVGAIATGKEALLPGNTATFANYTSYSRGINGVMIDIAGLEGGVPVLDDFRFRVGNNETPTTWATAPDPTVITVGTGQGTGGSDRVTLIWNDDAIRNQWLQVTVLAGGNTNLGVDDIFYFGNAVGEAGNSTLDAKVNAVDVLLARNNPRTFLNPAPVDFDFDYNRDKRVNATDVLLARNKQTHLLDALKLIRVPYGKSAAAQEPWSDETTPDELAWLYDLEANGAMTQSSKKDGEREPTVADFFST